MENLESLGDHQGDFNRVVMLDRSMLDHINQQLELEQEGPSP